MRIKRGFGVLAVLALVGGAAVAQQAPVLEKEDSFEIRSGTFTLGAVGVLGEGAADPVVAYLDARTDFPDLPDGVPVAATLDELAAFVDPRLNRPL